MGKARRMLACVALRFELSSEVMARLKIRCIDNRPFLSERGGVLRLGHVDGREMISLRVGQVYDALEEDAEYYRVWDDSGEDYLYPKAMFELAV